MKTITIGFSGHRDKKATKEQLFAVKDIFDFYQEQGYRVKVVHGGAKGFDSQMHRVVQRLRGKKYKYNIDKPEVIRPEYGKHPGRSAPIKRNETIVNKCDIMIILWDGREKGGTFFTKNYAEKKDKTVYLL